MAEGPHVRLNMIVKNEARVILGALQSAAPLIASFCVVDTGSDDDTVARIEAWARESGVPGVVHVRPWTNFGENRTEALDLAVEDKTATHVLFLDADDRFTIDPQFSCRDIDVGVTYQIKNQSGPLEYFLPGLIDVQTRRWRWREPLHEYLECMDGAVAYRRLEYVQIEKNVVVGGRSTGLTTAAKYLRDAAIFEEGLKADPQNARSHYYLANSYRDAGNTERALQAYLRRIEVSGWDEETFDAMVQAGLCFERLGRIAEAIFQFQKAWEYRKTRREPLYHCTRIFRQMECYGLACHFAGLAKTVPEETSDTLFVDRGNCTWKLDDEASVAQYYEGNYQLSLELSLRALETFKPPEEDRRRIVQTAAFARDRLLDLARRPVDAARRGLGEAGARQAGEPETTVSIRSDGQADVFRRTVNSFLNCCLDVQRVSKWICMVDGRRDIDLTDLRSEFPSIQFFVMEGKGRADMMNNILDRTTTDYWIHLDGGWEFILPDYYIGRAIEALQENPDIAQILFNKNYMDDVEDTNLMGAAQVIQDRVKGIWGHVYLEPKSQEHSEHLRKIPKDAVSVCYWPHYALGPSCLKTPMIRSLGSFDQSQPDFELEFGLRFYKAGFKSAFLYRLACVRIDAEPGEQVG